LDFLTIRDADVLQHLVIDLLSTKADVEFNGEPIKKINKTFRGLRDAERAVRAGLR
jgi:hypothetical protein